MEVATMASHFFPTPTRTIAASANTSKTAPVHRTLASSSSSLSSNFVSPVVAGSVSAAFSGQKIRPECLNPYSSKSRPKRGVVTMPIARFQGQATDVELARKELKNVKTELVEADAEVAEKSPRKPRVKLGDIMGMLNKIAIDASEKERPVPGLRTGDLVQIKLEVPENKCRMSIYQGIVMSKQKAGIHTAIRIRRIIAGIGVEIVFPIYSPNIKEIRVMGHRKVRRARLYYLRDKLPRLSTFK